jgi:hypothetical protein
MSWVLVLLKVTVDFREGDRRWIGEGRLGNLCCKIVEKLAEEGESGSDGVLLVSDDYAYSTRVSPMCVALWEKN